MPLTLEAGVNGSESTLQMDGQDVLGIFGATVYSKPLDLTWAATIAWDAKLGQTASVVLTALTTFGAPTNLKKGAYYGLEVIQDGVGNRTGLWASVFKFTQGSAPILSTGANARDYFVFRSDGVNLYEQGRSQGVA